MVPNVVDSNHDKALSADEVMAAPQQLVTLDENGDGAIDWKEIEPPKERSLWIIVWKGGGVCTEFINMDQIILS